MNATTILSLLTEGKTEQAILLLKQDIAGSTAASKDTYKARVKLATAAHKEHKESRPALAGAWTDGSKQVIVNGYWLTVYNDIADGLIQADPKLDKLNYKQILPTSTANYTLININLDIVASELKISKAEKQDLLIKCGTSYFNPKYLLSVLSTFENPICYLGGGLNPMYIKADNGEGLILPMRYNEDGTTKNRVVIV